MPESKTKPIVLAANKDKAKMRPGPESMSYLTFWVSSGCNQRCDYCATEGNKRDSNPLSHEVLLDVIDQAERLKVKEVNINGSGEPLLYPGMLDLAKHIHQKGIALRISTNGTNITAPLARELYDVKASLVIKLHSVRNAAMHDTLVGKNGSHELILRGIGHLLEAGFPNVTEDDRFRYSQIGIMTLLAQPCYHEIENILGYCAENVFYPMIDDIVVAGGMDVKKYGRYALSEDEKHNVAEMYERIMSYPITTDTLDICAIDTGGIFIGKEGRYYSDAEGSCCDALANADLGDVRNKSLRDVWAEILALREKSKLHMCNEFQRHRKEHCAFSCYGMWKSQKNAGVGQ